MSEIQSIHSDYRIIAVFMTYPPLSLVVTTQTVKRKGGWYLETLYPSSTINTRPTSSYATNLLIYTSRHRESKPKASTPLHQWGFVILD